MKTSVLLLGLLGLCVTSHAQKKCIQKYKGQVLLHTDKGDGVANIAIAIDGIQGEKTDQNGVFFFTLTECPGMNVQLKLNDPTYGIVNHVEMARYTLQQLDRPAQFQFIILVAPKKELETDRIAYYSAIAGLALEKGLGIQKGKIAELEASLKRQDQKNDRLVDSLATLRAQYAQELEDQANRPKEIEEIAKLFAKQIQIDSSYQKAFGFYKVGKLSEALRILPDEPMKDEKQRFQSKLNLAKRIEQEARKERDNYISKSLFKAVIYRNLNESKKALEWYREAISADSTQVDNIITLATFMRAQNIALEPERRYRKALSLNPTEQQKGTILNNLGNFYADNNRVEEAEAAYLQAKQIRERLVEKNAAQYEPALAITLNNLGVFYMDNRRVGDAEAAYQQAKQIQERLVEKNPDQYEPDLAATLNSLGVFYRGTKRAQEAEAAYLQAKQIQERLVEKNPIEYEPDLARTLSNLGYFYETNNRVQEAEAAFVQAKQIRERLVKKNPDQYEPALATTLNNLGNFYADNNRVEEAEAAYLQAKQIRERLVEKYPAKYESALAITFNNLGNLYGYGANRRVQEAEAAYLKAEPIWERLVEKNPDQYESYLVNTLNNLGLFYEATKRIKEAEAAYLQIKQIRERLVEKNPARYEPALARTLTNLGKFYGENNRVQEAETAYLQARQIQERLVEKNAAQYEPALATTLNNLAGFYRATNRVEEADTILKEIEKLRQNGRMKENKE